MFDLGAVVGPNGAQPIFDDADKSLRSGSYRIRCDKISPHSRIEIILALDRSSPDWAVGDIQYDVAHVHRSDYPTICVNGNCQNLDARARHFVADFK